MTIINFAKEAAKRNVKIDFTKTTTPVDKTQEPVLQEEINVYKGEYVHNEDKVLITVEPNSDRVTLDLYDTFTNEKYTQFTFDSYSLFLIVETSRRMFKELDGVINNEAFI